MSEPILISKANPEYNNYPCWVDTFDSSGERIRPHIICDCGNITNIRNHHIHSDGRITESYYHAQKGGCGWHVYLKMEGWTGEEFLPGQDHQNPAQ